MATPADARELLAIYAPAVTDTPITFEIVPPTLRQFARRMMLILKTYPWLVCEMDNRIAGFSYAGPHRSRPAYQWSVETAIYVHPDYRRRGVARALYRTLLELLRVQGFNMAYAGITLPNEASVALHLSIDFEPVGIYQSAGFKLGSWWDAAWYQRPLNDRLPDNPPSPLPLVKAIDTPAWRAAMLKGIVDLESPRV